MKISGPCAGACQQGGHAPASSQTRANQSSAVRASAASASAKSKAELTVYTAEGDKVTLSTSSSDEAGRFDYGLRSGGLRRADFRERGGFRYAAQESSISIDVEGDLSSEELADIQKLAKILGRASTQASRGNGDAAAQTAAKALQLESVATFEYSYESSVEYSFAATKRRSPIMAYQSQFPELEAKPASPEAEPLQEKPAEALAA